MTIEELLPDDPAFIVHKRILRGVTVRPGVGVVIAECDNETQRQYVQLVAGEQLLEEARKRFKDNALQECSAELRRPEALRTLPLFPEGQNVRRVPHPEHVLSTYAPGTRNEQAVTRLGQFATSAGADRTTAGLLYVHGQKDVGKTHLLDTVVNEWVSDGLQVQTYSGEGLLAELSSAGVPRGQNLQAYWKSQMKQARYLAIDDVDVLLRPDLDWAQADLCMILEALEEVRGRCIITAGHALDDRSNQVEEGLAAILRKAEVVELKPADLPARRAIAWDCLLHSHVRVTRDVVDFIANSVADVPKLLAVCHNVSVAADKEGGIGIKNVQSVLRKQGISVRKEDMPDVARKTVAAAIEAMGERISLESIAGQRLRQDVIPLRNQIIVRLVEERSLKQKMVAEAFGISTQAVSLIVKQTRTKM